MSDPALFLAAVRKAALPGIWSNGVNLSRNGAVAVESRTDKELVLRVRAPGRPVAPTVVLYPQDESWECDCPSRVDPCEHVVAGAISFNAQTPLVAAENKWCRVVYRFSRVPGGLELKRVLAQVDGSEKPLDGSLASMMARPAQAATLQVEDADLVADRLLERPTRGALTSEKLDLLLKVLEPARNVLLDGKPVAITDDLLLPHVTVEDVGENVVVTVARDPSVTEVLSPGVALCGDVIAKLGETALSGTRLQLLPMVRSYGPEQRGELTLRVLPDLARRLPVDVKSRRLPPVDRDLKPRVLLELTQLDAGLSILPLLVYGAPPSVRMDGNTMVYLKQGAVPLRDEPAEQRLLARLRDDLNLMPGRRLTVPTSEIERWAEKLQGWRASLSGDAAGKLGANVMLRPTLKMDGSTGAHGAPQVKFSLDFAVEGGAGETRHVDASAVMQAWRDGLGLVPIEGGGWAPLPREWLAQHGQRVMDLLAARQPDGTIQNHALPALGELCETLDQPPPPGLERLAPLVQGFETLQAPVLPAGLNATLRPYQLHGVAWLQFLKSAGLGGILADDMGLGKTLQTICVLGKGTLVVCPTSVLSNWEAELKRFRPDLKVATYHGPGRALDPQADITLTTYALMRLDAPALGSRTWDTLILDEAQSIKNPDSQVARAAYGLKATFRVALSGTPLENRLEELWSLMHFTNPGLLGGRRDFEEHVARPVADGRPDAASRFRKRIRPFVLRRLKKDVAPELPPRTESVLRVTLDDRERAVYDAVYSATREQVVAMLGEGGNVLKALEALLRLRQAACHSALVPGQSASSSSKVQRLVDALTTAVADGHKALVFSQWTSLLDLIEPALKDADIRFERLDGATTHRGDVTARFQSPDGAPVMLISLKAGGTGLNLTAADHVFLVDPWWNPAVEAQAADRAHRIGQQRPVNVYRLVSQGTVEERILGLQESKRALFEAALGDGTAATSLTREDLLQLFA